jgi:hypothetical protein
MTLTLADLGVLAPTPKAGVGQWATYFQHGSSHDVWLEAPCASNPWKVPIAATGRRLVSPRPPAQAMRVARAGLSDRDEGVAQWAATRRGVAAAPRGT